MSIIIFLIILSALVIVHEFGHFSVAKRFGIRVDEFGLGFPPRAKKLFTRKGTLFTLNWLPFGGFVKIYGENYENEELSPDSFQSKNRGIQAAVLSAGVAFNLLFAWALFSIGFVIGIPAPMESGIPVNDPRVVITSITPNSPADLAGFKSGDVPISLARGEDRIILNEGSSPMEVSDFISKSTAPITFELERGEETILKEVEPKEGIVEDHAAVGITMSMIGVAKLPLHEALWHGLVVTYDLTINTAVAMGSFIAEAVSGKADFSSVAGPVGIVGIVGDASALGFTYLLTFTALISINLAIINILPFPALDGGRLFFVIVEAITRKRVPAVAFNLLNTIGFALLILLMIVITVHDIRNIL